jgi:hypothetical protein
MVYLSITSQGPDIPAEIEEVIYHEVAHAVLATYFAHPHFLPPWLDEGLASLWSLKQNDHRRTATLEWWRDRGFPSLSNLFAMKRIRAKDVPAYIASTTLCEFLLEQKDMPTLIRFAEDLSKEKGDLDSLLMTHFGIGEAEIQEEWENWLRKAG